MSTAAQTPELASFSQDIRKENINPLWERTVSQKPGSPCLAKIWHWSDLEPRLLEAAKLIGTKDAERRVLMLENPVLPGSSFVTQTLFTGLQIILPGEVAAAHRHTPNALRFVVKGKGAYTSVDGERVMMNPGDFIVTPNWAWHDHGNIGSEPVVWMDGLDSAFTKFFGATFREDFPQDVQPLRRSEGDALASFGSALLPVDYRCDGHASPLLVYPYTRSLDALRHLQQSQPLHPSHGVKLRYANPANGRHPFPTMAAFLQLLPKGFESKAWRSTESQVFNVAEGRGSVTVGDETFHFTQHDIFVVPPWLPVSFRVPEDAVIFSYTDRAAQDALGFLREEIL